MIIDKQTIQFAKEVSFDIGGLKLTFSKLTLAYFGMQKSLAEYLRELREQKDVSLREVARQIGKSAVHISDIEAGRKYPSNEILKSLAEYFDVTFDDLKSRDSRPPIDEIKRYSASHPSLGFAFRTAMDEIKEGKVSAEEIARRLRSNDQ